MKKMSRFLKSPEGMFLSFIGVLVIGLLAYYFYAAPAPVDTSKPVDISISKTDNIRGALNGKVTLVEFGDFQCPACASYEPIVRQVLADNKDTLKIVYKHFPLTQIHRNALSAAKATEAAALQGKFWEMHDILYDKQDEWSGALNARDFYLTYATTIGLDTTKFSKDLESKVLEEKVLAEFKEGVSLGVQGTPTFFLNGKKLENPRDLGTFNKLIKDAAAAAATN